MLLQGFIKNCSLFLIILIDGYQELKKVHIRTRTFNRKRKKTL